MRNIKGKRGITLIALAVTIVVILILAGVTIDVVFSDDGIINKAKEAANRMNNLVKEDEAELNELLNELNETMDSNWNSNIEIPDPEPDLPTNIEDVTEIQEETVQVEDEYGNKVTIPKGFEVVEEEGTTVPEGIVIQDRDGNQFVWIPVGRVYKDNTGTNYSDIQLGRYTFNTSNGTPTLRQAAYTEENPENYEQLVKIESYFQEYTTRSNPDGIASSGKDGLNAIAKNLAGFIESVKGNYGYYLARYEASYGSGNNLSNYKPLSKVSINYNEDRMNYKEGTLWNYVTQINATKISRNMYDKNDNVGVDSDLVNSYAWDTAILFIQEMENSNYSNITNVKQKLENTGTTEDKVCNVYDLSSNCIEWTTESSERIMSGFNTNYSAVYRGASYYANTQRTSSRVGYDSNYGDKDLSFRVLIYIK